MTQYRPKAYQIIQFSKLIGKPRLRAISAVSKSISNGSRMRGIGCHHQRMMFGEARRTFSFLELF